MKKNKFDSVTIAYFSGTGGSEFVAETFYKQLRLKELSVKKIDIAKSMNILEIDSDLLILISPVYAFRLAQIVEVWADKLNPSIKSVAIIAVSGGGELSPNTACRLKCKNILLKKGYDVFYEDMIVMPSNFATQAKEEINLLLLQKLPIKVKDILENILRYKRRLIKPKKVDVLLSYLGKTEHIGAMCFGKFLSANSNCNVCKKCVKNCPKANIKVRNGKIKFGLHCMWCMKCIYSCPQKAIQPKILKSVVLKNGFDIEKLQKKSMETHLNEAEIVNDIFWQGAIDYIRNKSETK